MTRKILAAFTMHDMEQILYPERAEFKRGKDKKKRKSRGMGLGKKLAIGAGTLGLAGAAALGGRYLLKKRAAAINAMGGKNKLPGAPNRAALPGAPNRAALPGAGQTTRMSRTERSTGAMGGKNDRPGVVGERNLVKPNYETRPTSQRPSGGYRSNNPNLNTNNKKSSLEEGRLGQKFFFNRKK